MPYVILSAATSAAQGKEGVSPERSSGKQSKAGCKPGTRLQIGRIVRSPPRSLATTGFLDFAEQRIGRIVQQGRSVVSGGALRKPMMMDNFE